MHSVGQGKDSSERGMSLGQCCYSIAIPVWQRQVQALSKAAKVGPGTIPGELYCSPGGDDEINLGVSPVFHIEMQIFCEF